MPDPSRTRTSSNPKRATLATFIVASVALFGIGPGCWNSNNLKAPDLSEQLRIVDQETSRQRQIHTIMQRDLEQIDALIDALLAEPPSRYLPPFPIQTFRVAAMSCLHQVILDEFEEDEDPLSTEIPSTPTGEGQAETPPRTPVEIAARDFGVSCTPEPLAELDARLQRIARQHPDQSPAIRELTSRQLQRVEAIRRLRNQLNRRQKNLHDITNQARQVLAEQRASWRRTATAVDARRFDYTREELAEARDALQDQRERQNTLEQAIVTLEEDSSRWPRKIQAHLDELTYELAWLGQPESIDQQGEGGP